MSLSEQISACIIELGDWRGQVVAQLRQIVLSTDPEIVEDWKWNTGVWTKNGLICAFGIFKDHVKLNVFHGAMLPDPVGLFNSGLEAKKSRSIDFYEGDVLNKPALKQLITAAIALHNAQ